MNIIIIVIIILLILFTTKINTTKINTTEGFSYKSKTKYQNKPNILNADKWETRFPYMVNVKYSYNDKPIPKDYIEPTLHDEYALLNELPTEIKNVHHAKINPCLYFSIQP